MCNLLDYTGYTVIRRFTICNPPVYERPLAEDIATSFIYDVILTILKMTFQYSSSIDNKCTTNIREPPELATVKQHPQEAILLKACIRKNNCTKIFPNTDGERKYTLQY